VHGVYANVVTVFLFLRVRFREAVEQGGKVGA
jgi:hypothetical protein